MADESTRGPAREEKKGKGREGLERKTKAGEKKM